MTIQRKMSAFSFHCMICFEEFEVAVRYPVVLPCGHTYVCNLCAERLEKCMECRTSLVITIPRGPADNNSNNSSTPNRRSQGRTGRWSGPGHHTVDNQIQKTPPQPPIKRRLPLPKNVVLLSLIEATELAAEDVHSSGHHGTPSDSPLLKRNHSILDVEEDEEEAKIRAGTSLAISDCGTYAVAARDGLEIYPSRPTVVNVGSPEEGEEDVDTLVRFFHLDHKLDVENGQKDGDSSPGEAKDLPPVRLACGDRVQIVSTEAGWAKLARGYGFVRADGNQLVKGTHFSTILNLLFLPLWPSDKLCALTESYLVGGSVDRACKLEALLRLLSSRRRQLRSEQMRVDNQFIALMNDLQLSLINDEDLTVIAADTFEKSRVNNEDFDDIKAEVRDNESSGHPPGREERALGEDTTPLKPRPTVVERPLTPPGDFSRGFFCAGTDVFDTMMPLGRSRQPPPPLPRSAGSPAVVGTFSHSMRVALGESPSSGMWHSVSHPSPSALRAGARAWREMHGRPPSAGIDFRTGLSGHSALLSTSAHPHDYLEPSRAHTFRGMSNHTGLTMWKSARGHLNSPGSLAMPTFGSDSPQRDEGSTTSGPTTPTQQYNMSS